MKGDLFSETKRKTTQFAENIWLCQIVSEAIANLLKFEQDYELALESQIAEDIKQTKLQLDAALASLKLASYLENEQYSDQ